MDDDHNVYSEKKQKPSHSASASSPSFGAPIRQDYRPPLKKGKATILITCNNTKPRRKQQNLATNWVVPNHNPYCDIKLHMITCLSSHHTMVYLIIFFILNLVLYLAKESLLFTFIFCSFEFWSSSHYTLL